MQYNPPTGGAANDPYVGRNIAAGIQGSKVPPAAVEFPQREIMAVIAAAIAAGLQITPTNSDLTQLTQAVDYLIAMAQAGAATNGGLALTSNKYSLDLDNLPVETGLNGTDKLALYAEESEDGLSAGTPYAATLATIAAYILAEVPAAPNSDKTLWHEGSIGGTASAMTVTLSPAAVADEAGINMRLLAGQFVSAANATLDFGFGPRPIVINSTNLPVTGGEMEPNEAFFADFYYDGQRVRLLNPIPQTPSQNFVTWKVYTANATYTPDPGCTIVDVIGLWGPGGTGGTDSGSGGGGGGGGGFAAGSYAVAQGQGYPIVLPAGGSGGTASFGSFCSATAGGNGSGANPGSGGQGYGQATFPGLPGIAANTVSNLYFPGPGGSAFQSAAPTTSGPVYNGVLPGAGGTGGNSRGTPGATAQGGTGGPSLLIIRQRSAG